MKRPFKLNRGPRDQKEKIIDFMMMRNLFRMISKKRFDYLASILKSLRRSRFRYGMIEDFYRTRNSRSFRSFLAEKELHELVRQRIEEMYRICPSMNLLVSRRGLLIFDNYLNRRFNTLLLTIHGGTWVPRYFHRKMSFTDPERRREEDIGSNDLYSGIVLNNGGIWIDNMLSRFCCDFNRSDRGCIYFMEKERWLRKEVWSGLTDRDISQIHVMHTDFYQILYSILEAFRFNIIFDGHTMKNKPGRPAMSFGTRYVPKFYMPIVSRMRTKLHRMGYSPIFVNRPYGGGFILKWLNAIYPYRFIFSMEINKREYMNSQMTVIINNKKNKIRNDISELFDL